MTRLILSIFNALWLTKLQKKKDNAMTVVAYYSKHTTIEQHKYHSYELETIAVMLALQYFSVYPMGTSFKVVTDCVALHTTFTKKH